MRFETGERVRIKAPSDWPSPPGYRFAGAEGTVVKWVEYDAVMADFTEAVMCVRLERVPADAEAYAGDALVFRVEDVERL
jgi:hypothetical protein